MAIKPPVHKKMAKTFGRMGVAGRQQHQPLQQWKTCCKWSPTLLSSTTSHNCIVNNSWVGLKWNSLGEGYLKLLLFFRETEPFRYNVL